MIRRLRIISQLLFFVGFVYLLCRTQYTGDDTISLPVRLLIEIDPLAALTTFLANGAVRGLMWLSLITIVLTLVFGRFFCGWVCPLGTLIHLTGKLPVRNRKSIITTNRRHPSQVIKYYLLTGLLVAAIFGLQLSGIFDPLSIITRSFSLIVLPGVEIGLRAFFEWAYQVNPMGIADITEPIYSSLQDSVMNFNQPHFHQVAFIGFIFIAIMVISFTRYRFWCRTLCPLGALLGTVARFGFFRVKQKTTCSSCRRCTFRCQGGADPEERGRWSPSECVVCGNCDTACSDNYFGFDRPRLRLALPIKTSQPETHSPDEDNPVEVLQIPPQAMTGLSIHRRHFLLSGLAGLVTAPTLNLGESSIRPNPSLIRPPGARGEREFLELCVRCGECMKVCLTNGLQPTLLEAGLAGLWSPRLVPRIGYCEFNCTLCGQVCPTQAIKVLSVEEKRTIKIGMAVFDTTRCLPYAYQTPCIVCEEHCPLPRKAIWFVEQEVVTHDGRHLTLKQPRVDLDLCIGCGICETRCVIQDKPAIRVTSANEDRNPANRVRLAPTGMQSGDPYGSDPNSSDPYNSDLYNQGSQPGDSPAEDNQTNDPYGGN